MRVLDRLTAVVVALTLVLAGLGAPGHPETPEPGAVLAAAHRSIAHDVPSAPPPHGRPVGVTTPDRPAPPSGDPRAVVARPARPDAPSAAWTALSGGNGGDHRAGVVANDGLDDLLPAAKVRAGGTPDRAVAATGYRQPAVPLPPRGVLPTRAPPAVA